MGKNTIAWLLVSLFYAYQYILRVLPNVIEPELINRFHISVADAGQFSSWYYIGYPLAHIPVGILLDKFGPRLILSICVILTFSGIIPLICFDSWDYSKFGRIIIGIGSSASALGLFKVASMYYSQEKFARMVSFSITIGLLGAMCGNGLPLHFLLSKFGWDCIFLALIIFGCFLTVSIFFLIPKYNSIVSYDKQTHTSLDDLKNLICNKDIILISFFGGLMVGPLQGFADARATTFLAEVYGLSKEIASFLPSLIFIGMCFGLPSLAYILEKKPNKHHEIIIFCSAIMIFAFILLLSSHINIYVIVISLLLIGFASGYQVIVTCKAISYASSNMLAIATAITNMIIMFFGYFFHTVISKIIDLYWNGEVIDDKPVYGAALLMKSISIIPISLVIAIIGFLWLRKKHNKKI